jgi:hypothetical protein
MTSMSGDPRQAFVLRNDPAGIDRDVTTTLAAAGTSASDAGAIVSARTVVTGASGANGVVLPAALTNLGPYTVVNDDPVFSVFVYPVNGGNDAINELAEDAGYLLGPDETATFQATGAAQWYTGKKSSYPSRATHFEVFDDFTYASIDTTNNWIVFGGSDANAVAAAVSTAPEGTVLIKSGNAGSTEDGSAMSLILLAKGSLVSLGPTIFECRVSADQLTGVEATFGLADKLATTAEHNMYTVDSGVVADGGLTHANGVCFSFSSDATASTKWTMCSENGGTIDTTERASSRVAVADTYDTLRIEVDEDGDARFYINGTLERTETTAVATTSLLIPYLASDGGVDAQADTIWTVDYVYFAGNRPAAQ